MLQKMAPKLSSLKQKRFIPPVYYKLIAGQLEALLCAVLTLESQLVEQLLPVTVLVAMVETNKEFWTISHKQLHAPAQQE